MGRQREHKPVNGTENKTILYVLLNPPHPPPHPPPPLFFFLLPPPPSDEGICSAFERGNMSLEYK